MIAMKILQRIFSKFFLVSSLGVLRLILSIRWSDFLSTRPLFLKGSKTLYKRVAPYRDPKAPRALKTNNILNFNNFSTTRPILGLNLLFDRLCQHLRLLRSRNKKQNPFLVIDVT